MRRRPAVKDPRRSSTNAATVVAGVEVAGVVVEVAGVVVELVAAVAAAEEVVAEVPTAAYGLGRR